MVPPLKRWAIVGCPWRDKASIDPECSWALCRLPVQQTGMRRPTRLPIVFTALDEARAGPREAVNIFRGWRPRKSLFLDSWTHRLKSISDCWLMADR